MEGWMQRIMLDDGQTTILRPIRPEDGLALASGITELSAQTRYHRFLSARNSFTKQEIDYLTRCDGHNHIALVLSSVDDRGGEKELIAVARSIRHIEGSDSAEAAIIVRDEWQRRAAGRLVMRALAEAALETGIRYWHGHLLQSNLGARRLMDHLGTKIAERPDGEVSEVIYRLRSPHPPLSAWF
jgi:GNAT superfamily N-acetyltransferase